MKDYEGVVVLAELLKRVRRNHALEHATVAVLIERGVRPPLGGYSTPGGFIIVSRASRDEVINAAEEALRRLNNSEKHLAISPYCGTNLATGALLAGVATSVAMGNKRNSKIGQLLVVLASVAGAIYLGRRLGNVLQRKYTTLADVEPMTILNTRSLGAAIHRINTNS